MGHELSIMSMLGFTALTGVVINDSLILIVKVNDLVGGMNHFEAALEGSVLRFRPIFLTTLTTTAAIAHASETSMQAQFLIPMAVSLAFGLVFAMVSSYFWFHRSILSLRIFGPLSRGMNRRAITVIPALNTSWPFEV